MAWWRRVRESYWLRVIGGSALLMAALPLVLQRACITKDYGEGVLVGTGVAVLWYTVEAFYLRRETVRQNEILVSPFLIAYMTPPNVVLKNVGKGLALFVRVDDMTLRDPVEDLVRSS